MQKVDKVKAQPTQLTLTAAEIRQRVDLLVTAGEEKIFLWLSTANLSETGFWLTGKTDYIKWGGMEPGPCSGSMAFVEHPYCILDFG
jgi:hypothetical protein